MRSLTIPLLAILLVVTPALLTGCDQETCHGDECHAEGDGGLHHDEDGSAHHDEDAGALGESAAYCNCLLVSCHDPFHAQFGVSDEEAIANCIAAADALPRNGSPTESGANFECRVAHCEMAEGGAATCDAALGAAPCM